MRKWKLTLVVVGMFCFGSVWGQFGKERVITQCEVCVLEDAFVVDFDNDKDLDVISASFRKLAWYRNEGGGKFSNQIIISEKINSPRNVIAADLDGDGDQDVICAVSNQWENRISWIRNDGNLNYSDEIEIAINISDFGNILAVDMDNDKDIDILPASYRGVWLQNDGKGNFLEKPIHPVHIYSTYEINAADFDNDGKPDMLFASNPLFWFKNNGDGVFTSKTLDSFHDRLGVMSSHIADLNGDGYKDIVIGLSSTANPDIPSQKREPTLRWYKNNGNGSFSNSLNISNQTDESISIKTADLDGDKDLDIIVAHGFYWDDLNHRIVWYENDGVGNFGEANIITEIDNWEIYFNLYANIEIGDIDNDNDIDIVSAIENNELTKHFNDGTGKFSSSSITGPQVQGVWSIQTGDIDRDGDLDVVSASYDDDKIAVFKNIQKGVFSKQIVISENANGARDVTLLDIDGDKNLDIVSASSNDHKIAWYKNEGKSGFSNQRIISNKVKGANCINYADLDGDGFQDIVAGASSEGTIVQFKNTGRGTFSDLLVIATDLDSILNIEVGDFDSDGDIDIISLSYDTYGIIFLNNDGKGNFSRQSFPSYLSTRQIHKVDLDKDGYLDLLSTASYQPNLIFWHRNNGNSKFTIKKIANDSLESSMISTTDFDKDGDIDIIVGSRENKVFWLENDGMNSFTTNNFISSSYGFAINSIVPADMDVDGDQDILYTSAIGDKIAWFENPTDHPSISGFAFWDENNNHKYDASEQKIINLPVNLEPTALASYTDAQGQYRFYAPEGKYRISVVPDSCWELSTDSLSYQVVLEKDKAQIRHFGFKPTSSAPKLKVRLNSAPTRCGFEVPFWLSLHNEACLFTQGRYGLVLSKLANFVQAEPAPSQIQGDTLFWDVDQLYGSQTKSVKLLFRIAGTDFLGDTILMRGLAYVKNNTGQLLLANTYDYRSEIRCAYDPNDKLVQPTRIPNYSQNLTLFKERMEYTIRFQNTGTDTAFTVVIRDTLDGNLDWKTFKPIMASHPVETHLGKDGAVEFLFRNILLPPTKTNEPLSHGFVRYQISAKSGLAEQTEIANTAHIYFDYNPPITTNTAENVMVSTFPKKGGGQGQTGVEAKVYPNPFFDYLQVEIVKNSSNTAPYTFYLQNSQAQVLLSQQLNGVIERINTGRLPSGLYFYLIKNTQGRVVASGKVVCH